MILGLNRTAVRYHCTHCRRGFRTFAAYQRHSSKRLSLGRCEAVATQRPLRSPPRERPAGDGNPFEAVVRPVLAIGESIGHGIHGGLRAAGDFLSGGSPREYEAAELSRRYRQLGHF